ncbi:nucleotide-binding protein [bacterium]|nr:nucleotide-binding protein [bacterium]
MAPNDVQEELVGNNITFKINEIQNARQFVFEDGAILCVYNSGKIVWQGKDSETRKRVEELLGQTSSESQPSPKSDIIVNKANNSVFIVYGHDSEAREQLELLLRRVKLEPIVLQNLPSGGQTIIEKLETSSDVTYACVLLTPDDMGHAKDLPDKMSPRARQNVVLELGMFLAKLGRKRVAILHKGNVELPSDINGLIYLPFNDRVDEIKDRLGAELQNAGFNINIKDLLC